MTEYKLRVYFSDGELLSEAKFSSHRDLTSAREFVKCVQTAVAQGVRVGVVSIVDDYGKRTP